jgi:chromosome segregation ATPase
MDSVYKLTKYSQKITDACQKKQYEKIGLYNKHENLYIKKLNEYFCNQKGGAAVDELRTFFSTITDKISDIIRVNKELTEKVDTDKARFESDKLELQKEIDRVKSLNEDLRDNERSLGRDIWQLQEQLRQKAHVEAQEVIEERNDLKSQSQLQELERLMEEQEKEISMLKSEVGPLKAKNIELMRDKESLEARILSQAQELQDKSSADSEAIGRLQQRIDSLTAEALQKEEANAERVRQLTEQLEIEKARLQEALKAAAAKILAGEGTGATAAVSGTEVGGGRRRR